MLQHCNPQSVEKAYLQARSWRKVVRALNGLYGVRLSHAAWRGYAKGKHDIANPDTHTRLMLPARACPSCGHKHTAYKQNKQKQIRNFGYFATHIQPILEVLNMQEAPR